MHRWSLVPVVLAAAMCGDAFANCADAIKAGANPRVRLSTSMGDIVLELDSAKAPVTTENFARYVDSGHYDGTAFHRVIDNFMIQGGGFTQQFAEKPTQAPIRNEASNGLRNDAYTIAMARTADPNSATAQFFINSKDNDFLNYGGDANPGYAVFGKVVQGRETVDKIRKVPVKRSAVSEAQPLEPVVIKKAECVAAPADAKGTKK